MRQAQTVVEALLADGAAPRDGGDALSPQVRDLAEAVFRLQLAQRRLTAQLQQHTGLSESDLTALGLLLGRNPSPVKDLSAALGLTHGSTSTLVDRLTRAGMVTRTTSTQDRRVALISITAHGADVMAGARDRYVFAIMTALDATSDDCLDTTSRVLRQIARTLPGDAAPSEDHTAEATAAEAVSAAVRARPHAALQAWAG